MSMETEKVVSAVSSAAKSEPTSDIDEVTSRTCSSDNYDGVSITIVGRSVLIRPLLEAVGRLDEWRVENIGMYSDAAQTELENGDLEFYYGVIMFCAYIGDDFEQDIFT